MKTTIILNALDIDPTIYFLGSDKEIEEAEKKEARQAAIIEKLIFSGDTLQKGNKTHDSASYRK